LRTLLDLAAAADRHLARAAEEAQVRHLIRSEQLETATGPGSGRLRALSGDTPTLTRSEAERRLMEIIIRAQLPRPRTNVKIHGHEVDALWPEQGLIVEVDGYAFHRTRQAFERDRRRDALMQAHGLRVIRTTWCRLSREPEAVAAQLGAALARAQLATYPQPS
jgi:very-short-patch-repair endonuclease